MITGTSNPTLFNKKFLATVFVGGSAESGRRGDRRENFYKNALASLIFTKL
jgi:hypothetical protein